MIPVIKTGKTLEECRGKTTVVTKSDFLSYPPSPISPLLKIVTVLIILTKTTVVL